MLTELIDVTELPPPVERTLDLIHEGTWPACYAHHFIRAGRATGPVAVPGSPVEPSLTR